MDKEINIEKLNREEALRYMGIGGREADSRLLQIIEECEQELLDTIRPKYVYRVFDKEQLRLPGNDIRNHIKGCEKAVLMCATISGDVDKLIRTVQINDLSKAFVLDTLASVAVEQVCEAVEKIISKEMPEYHMTWRYGVGYGDFSLDFQRQFINLVNAAKQIGVCVTSNNILTPRKSVTCVIGLSKEKILKGKRGCGSCNMAERCQYRKRGGHCGF